MSTKTKKKMIIEATKKILPQYTQKITLRQLYYRIVSKLAGTGIFDNVANNYTYLSRVLVEARLSGQIPFNAIEDRTRAAAAGDNPFLTPKQYFEKYLQYLIDCKDDYSLPKWHNQNYYIEVWMEKDALSGLFGTICRREGVVLSTVRGYPSLTMLKDAADRLNDELGIGKEIIILYFGDMDPSGQDIPRHIEETLKSKFGCYFKLVKCAITKNQIMKYKIIPMPAKKSDSRYKNFSVKYGEDAVELDAIEPDVLETLIAYQIRKYFNEDVYNENVDNEETKGRKEIAKLFPKVIKKEVLDKYK